MPRLMLPTPARPAFLLLLAGVLVIGLVWPLGGAAQNTTPNPAAHQHAVRPADADQDLPAQLRELKAKTAALEAALEQRYPGAVGKDAADGNGMSPMSGGMGAMGDKGMGMTEATEDDELMEMMQTMRAMMQMKMMQMMNKNMMGDMSGMPGKGMGMMGMEMKGDKGMGMMSGMSGAPGNGPGASSTMGMGRMGMEMMGGKAMDMMQGTSGMQMPSALPGFPGASHIYHIGATGFFLDHPRHIQLSTRQQADLNGIKEKALLGQVATQRKIDDAEQQLWTLTASDQPESVHVDALIREVEKLRGDQRIAFIGAVGEAAKILTPEQRQMLVGMLPPNHAPDAGR